MSTATKPQCLLLMIELAQKAIDKPVERMQLPFIKQLDIRYAHENILFHAKNDDSVDFYHWLQQAYQTSRAIQHKWTQEVYHDYLLKFIRAR